VGDIIAIGSAYAPDGSLPHAVYLNDAIKLEKVHDSEIRNNTIRRSSR